MTMPYLFGIVMWKNYQTWHLHRFGARIPAAFLTSIFYITREIFLVNKKPLVLLILDGWGHNDSPEHNAIYAANSPVWDKLWASQPTTLISGSGLDVGLPEGQMGNSEVGHMTLGAGRIVWQSLTRIDKAIADGDFNQNPAYLHAIDKAVKADKAVHLMGLLSPGGVHSHESHIHAAIRLAASRGAKKIYLHGFLDGRDTAPRSALASVEAVQSIFDELHVGRFASVAGRYYAMDRDNRWDRVEPVYNLITQGEAEFNAANAKDAVNTAYQRDENDEFVAPTSIGNAVKLEDGDALLFMNFRADRAREITRPFVETDFDGFERKIAPVTHFVMTTEYAANISAPIAFPPETLENSFGDYLSKIGKTQLRIAETEKYAHVTFFYSGGQEDLYEGEERILIPSPKVATYDLQPEMSAFELTDKLCENIQSGRHDAIICNYANGDMVGHTGIFEAAVKAVEAVDQCLEKIVTAVNAAGGQCLITADHGNVELMMDSSTGQALTSHTTEPVPFVYVGDKQVSFPSKGTLADVAPTMLALMDIEQPIEMSGKNIAVIG